jgi:hypothetical protein
MQLGSLPHDRRLVALWRGLIRQPRIVFHANHVASPKPAIRSIPWSKGKSVAILFREDRKPKKLIISFRQPLPDHLAIHAMMVTYYILVEK